MLDHNIKKPVIFVSHAASDGEFANSIKQEIEKVFANGVNVFCTSSPGSITVGREWLSDIEEKLKLSQAMIVIITPTSIERPWLWFEIGASWLTSKDGNCRIYPLCAPEIELSNLPSPLDRLQALSMGKVTDLKLLFQALIDQFGFGKISSFKATNITQRIPKYKNVKIIEVDLNEKSFYSGRYTGYSDKELMEVIDEKLFEKDHQDFTDYPISNSNNRTLIHNGKLLHYREIDKSLDLPRGTSKRLMNLVAAKYELEPEIEEENIVRYRIGEK